jgi:hypothetical protein
VRSAELGGSASRTRAGPTVVGMSSPAVSVAGATVGDMAQNHLHACTFFDDGDLDLVCVCGTRGAVVVDDDAPDGLLGVLLDDVDRPVAVTLTAPPELAVAA